MRVSTGPPRLSGTPPQPAGSGGEPHSFIVSFVLAQELKSMSRQSLYIFKNTENKKSRLWWAGPAVGIGRTIWYLIRQSFVNFAAKGAKNFFNASFTFDIYHFIKLAIVVGYHGCFGLILNNSVFNNGFIGIIATAAG